MTAISINKYDIEWRKINYNTITKFVWFFLIRPEIDFSDEDEDIIRGLQKKV